MNHYRVFGLLVAFIVCSQGWEAAAVGGFIKPEPLVTPQPRLADEVLTAPCTAYAQLQVNEHGFVTEATIVQSSDSRVNESILRALRRWKFRPATENGTPVSCYVVQPIRLVGGLIVTMSEQPADRDPKVRHSILPELPRELRTLDGYVTARVELDESGVVTRAGISDSTHAELDSYVLHAVKKWSFHPAIRGGQNASCRVAIPFRFKPDPSLLPRVVKEMSEIPTDAAPVATRRVSPAVPGALIGKVASAEVEFVVDEFGNVVNPALISASDDVFGTSALDAVTRWRFKPAVQNGQPVATKVRQEFSLNQHVLTEGRALADTQPKVRKSVTPDIPAALRGVQGQVDVWVAIDEGGNVTDAQVRRASYEEFCAPAVEAARRWKFAAAVRNGEPVASAAVVPFVFGQ